MTSRSKIVGITRQTPDQDEIASNSELHERSPEINSAQEDDLVLQGTDDIPVPDYQEWDYGDNVDEVVAERRYKSLILPTLLVIAMIGWTAYFGWTHYSEAIAGPSNERVTNLISIWSLPIGMIGILWLLIMRNSRAETDRFGDAARLLRNESEALEARMRTVNEEIATAREFLAQNALELDSVGRQSASRLTLAAEQLGVALADSDAKAKTLEEVSNAATSNLEQLRKHLPVVTSAAKDVTNQIGNAGNSAQVQVKSLIAALQKVAESGEIARVKVEEMTGRTTTAAEEIANSVDQSSLHWAENLQAAKTKSTDITKLLDHSSRTAAETIGAAANEVDQMISTSSDRLGSQVESLRDAITELQQESVEEDARIDTMIARLSAHIEQSATRLAEVDASATDRTAKLAFALETVADASKKLDTGFASNQQNSNRLIQDAERLLLALDNANQELGESLPAAFDHLQLRSGESLSQLENLAAKATDIDKHSDEMLARISTVQHLLKSQEQAFNALMQSSDTHFVSRQDQAETLSKALTQTRNLLSEMGDLTGDDLVNSVLRVSEATQQAATESRKIVDEELSTVADRLTEQNKAALANAVDSQAAALSEIMQGSIERSIAISQEATQKITDQLAQIDEMTDNLERRLETAHNRFDGTDDNSFARRMVLLTESLNSTAIDVAKILSNDVTDTAWAAYLKGDRGVFTRRAVRLLDAGEARIIAEHYGDDSEFSDHVNRYIHDFEAMMRVLLSTRDGNAIGVTLLSSDVGKLYVALAQAIERLRN